MLVRDIMTHEVVTVRDDKRLLVAKSIMEFSKIRHLPVVNAHADLIGLLTRGSLLAASTSHLERVPAAERDRRLGECTIRDVMVHDPMTIAADAPVATAAHLMVSRKVGCLLVVDGPRLLGIVTEIDLLRLLEHAKPEVPAGAGEVALVTRSSPSRN